MWHKSPKRWNECLFPSDSRARFGSRPNGIKHYWSASHSPQRPFTFSEDSTMRLRLSWEAKWSSYSLKKSYLLRTPKRYVISEILLRDTKILFGFFCVSKSVQPLLKSFTVTSHVTVKSYTGSVQCLLAWHTGLFLQHTVLLCTYESMAEDFWYFLNRQRSVTGPTETNSGKLWGSLTWSFASHLDLSQSHD